MWIKCPCALERESVSHFGHVRLFVTTWTVARQAPLSMGFFQARILGWVAISFSRGSFRPRDQTWVSCVVGRLFTIWGKCITLFQITLVLTGDVSSGMPKLLRNMSVVLSNKKVRIRAPELTWEPHYNKWWIQQRQSSRGSRFLELSWKQCYQSLEQTPPLASQNPSLILSCSCHTNLPGSELISISLWMCTPPPAASHSQTTQRRMYRRKSEVCRTNAPMATLLNPGWAPRGKGFPLFLGGRHIHEVSPIAPVRITTINKVSQQFIFILVLPDSSFLLWDPPKLSTAYEALSQHLFAGGPRLSWEDPLEKDIATHSSILAWEIPWTEEPSGLQSMGLQEVDGT